jgi:hypothetical protein
MNERLLPQHAALLRGSAISDDVAAARGYRSVEQKARLTELGFSQAQARVPALLIPIIGVHGDIVLYQLRPDTPRIRDGKAVKYETPAGARMALDVPPACRAGLADPQIPLFVTEGVRKADAAASAGLCCVALLGVWNFRGTNEAGGSTALADWESIALKGRVVHIVFDSDVMTKPAVHGALARLKAFLEGRGARVLLVYLPSAEGGAKVGLDDFLAAGHTRDELLALATPELRSQPGSDRSDGPPYRETPGGLVWERPTANGPVAVPLTNYRARITAQLVEDDGAEQRRLFEIEGSLGARTPRFVLPAGAFGAMNWPTEHLGATAVTYPGMGIRDHARVAIQMLSGEVPERTVYAHTGWREVSDGWVSLHGGGAIGPDGPVDGVETRLEGALARYILPEPPDGDALRESIRASLRLLDVAPDRVSVPLLAATYRAVLGATDHSLHLAGPTGVLKTELAALVQQHYGAAMDSRGLPGSWSSTGNLLEAIAFAAKDAVLVVDDFAPSGSIGDVQRLHRDADRLLRAQGNSSGRGRMRADTSLRPAKPPRGMVLSTGEDVPHGQSLRARVLVLEVGPGDVDAARLTACQADAAGGLYAAAMAGFVRSIAEAYPTIRAGLRAQVVRMRGEALDGRAHRRTPEIVANLALGIDHLLAFATAVGAVDPGQAAGLRERCWRALLDAASDQRSHQAASEPSARFVELLSAAVAAGRAHLADEEGDRPTNPGAWGWRRIPEGAFANESWRPMGERVGWVADEGDDLFLDPDASFAAAQRVGRDTGDPLAIAPRTLHRRLQQAGFLRSTDDVRGRLTVRRTLGDARRTVLHLGAGALEGAGRRAGDDGGGRDGPFAWAVPDDAPSGTAHEESSGITGSEHESSPPGPFGPVGPVPQQESPNPSAVDVDDAWMASLGSRVVQQPMDWTGVLDRSAGNPDATDWGIIE